MSHETGVRLLGALFMIISALFGTFFFMDDRHANAAEVEKLKVFTMYTVQELQLETMTFKLESLLGIPIEHRKPWEKSEIERLKLHVQMMQGKMAVEQRKKEASWFN